MTIERLTPHRHLQLVERVLHDVVRVQLVYLAHDDVDVGHQRVREQQELGPRHRLEAGHAELVRLEDLDARLGQARVGERRRGG